VIDGATCDIGIGQRPSKMAPTMDEPSSKSKKDYICTTTQTYVSRSADVRDATNLNSRGKSVILAKSTIHSDFGNIVVIGRYCHIGEGTELIPTVIPRSNDPLLRNVRRQDSTEASKPTESETALPLVIGSHTRIDANTRVQSVSIGSCVRIGSNCKLAPRTKIYDCCIIEDFTELPPDMVVPPFSRVRGSPGRIVGTLPECTGSEFVDSCVQSYENFVRELE